MSGQKRVEPLAGDGQAGRNEEHQRHVIARRMAGECLLNLLHRGHHLRGSVETLREELGEKFAAQLPPPVNREFRVQRRRARRECREGVCEAGGEAIHGSAGEPGAESVALRPQQNCIEGVVCRRQRGIEECAGGNLHGAEIGRKGAQGRRAGTCGRIGERKSIDAGQKAIRHKREPGNLQRIALQAIRIHDDDARASLRHRRCAGYGWHLERNRGGCRRRWNQNLWRRRRLRQVNAGVGHECCAGQRNGVAGRVPSGG